MEEKYSELKKAVEAAELVDAHAHNMITHASTIPFLSCFSEASGKALSFVPSTLIFKRSLRDIARLYSTEFSLEAIQNCRSVSGIATLSNKCIEAAKITAVLIDDGIELENMIDTWQHKYIVGFVGRILKIERLAEEILNEGIKNGTSWTLDAFTDTFTGRLTSFGDKDLDLRQANPLHLRNILEDRRFLESRIVLLRASYPFSREASYLSSIYHQVYLDFGLAVPKLSVHGMISTMKELLELAPLKKVMFSTGGCAFPETFYLGAKWAREVVFAVLRDACDDGDLSIPEALEAVADIFSENSKKLYKLDVK